MEERLDKIIVSQGLSSRREVQRLIRCGRVLVNEMVQKDPSAKFQPEVCKISVDGQKLNYRRNLYIMMNKPAGLLCVSRDPKAATVIDLLPPEMKRRGLFPAGRLDKDTVGLVVITDDGNFAHRMLSPKKDIVKCYHAIIDGPIGEREIAAFADGTSLEDGTQCRSAILRILSVAENPLVEVKITEGRYHQIKRMFISVNRKVLWLKRVSIGKLALDPSLEEGKSREINEVERALIFD